MSAGPGAARRDLPTAAARVGDAVSPRVLVGRRSRFGATPSKPVAAVVLVVVGLFFLAPLAAMAWFTVQSVGGGFTLVHWAALFDPAESGQYADLFAGLGNSAVLAVLTVAIVLLLLLPAMLLAELRFRRAQRVLELVCLVPLTVPTVVLVVGFVPVYRALQAVIGSDPWTLAFAIGVIVLPYAYRPIRAAAAVHDLDVLTEAARSLGAGWFRAVLRVVLPILRRGLLSSCLLTVSVVLGEFTIANFLGQNTFQTALLLLQQSDPYVATILALAALAVVFVLLVVIATAGSTGRSRRSR